ncbi:MAG: hypothetical protein M1829_000577 [Trizodia sp. TS-e1964]|nr:MAG: hypothetical protein M1829_000577 [Trizodia sp. TS-e1964]
MKLSNPSAIPVYTVSGSSTARPLPEWLARRRKRSLKKDPEFANRVELLQDFEFQEASSCVRVSEDGQWVMSTGTYKPQIHTHYLPHLSLSFARHTTSLNQTFLLLSSDYSKSLHLQTDRSLEFHTPGGCHYKTRISRYGRDLKYDKRSAEALIPAVGTNRDGHGEVYRLNLEIGRFMKGYEIDIGEANSYGLQGAIDAGSVNTAAIAEESHNLLAFGTSLGTVEFWDPRSRNRVGILPGKGEVTAVEFERNGLNIATGSSEGITRLYDLRSPIPFITKDQGYGYPIHTLLFMNDKIMSADKRIIKIWERDGAPWTSVEPSVDLNSVAWCRGSGMLLTANEGPQQHALFIPQLGPAPKWCSFLDNLVEEMSEHSSTYDNYKFLTLAELRTLNLSHLIGTSVMRPYMHGYFIDQKLYEGARLIVDPYIWEAERAKRVKEKIDKERESRIRGVKVKVNQKLADKVKVKESTKSRGPDSMQADRGRGHTARTEDSKEERPDLQKLPGGLLDDDRFKALFFDEDFAINEDSREFRLLNPSTTVPGNVRTRNNLKRARSLSASSGSDSGSADEISVPLKKPAKTAPNLEASRISSSTYKKSGHRPQSAMTASSSSRQPGTSLGSRLLAIGAAKPSIKSRVVGEKELTFVSSSKKAENTPDRNLPRRKRSERESNRRSASGNVIRNL